MKRLNKKQVMFLHTEIIRTSGGLDGLRDEGLLESAVGLPFQTFDGKELYPSLLEKAVKLGYGLIHNHSFIDGNKRVGLHAMLVFLDINHVMLEYEDSDLIQTILWVADGSLTDDDLLQWLQNHIV